jgi:hypothetical protein
MERVETSPQPDSAASFCNQPSTGTFNLTLNDGPNATGSLCGCPGVLIVDDRPLIRDCLGRSLLALDPGLNLTYLSSAANFGSTRQAGREFSS